MNELHEFLDLFWDLRVWKHSDITWSSTNVFGSDIPLCGYRNHDKRTYFLELS